MESWRAQARGLIWLAQSCCSVRRGVHVVFFRLSCPRQKDCPHDDDDDDDDHDHDDDDHNHDHDDEDDHCHDDDDDSVSEVCRAIPLEVNMFVHIGRSPARHGYVLRMMKFDPRIDMPQLVVCNFGSAMQCNYMQCYQVWGQR